MKSKVSVIIPSFNSRDHIAETLKSVCSQSYSNIEMIVIDDGSTDGSFDYLNNLKIPNLIVKTNRSKGACAARNYGYKLSSGDYIQYLDADDLLSKDKIEKQVLLLKPNPEHIAVCSTKHFYDIPENGTISDEPFMFSTCTPSDFLLNLYGANDAFEMVQTSAWLTPRVLIENAGPWDESLSKDQDGEFFCRVVMGSRGICYEPNVINYYRKHINGTNISGQRQRTHIESQLKALNSKANQLASLSHTEAYQKAMSLQYKFLAINAYPQFKDVSKAAIDISESLGGSDYVPVLGGRLIEFLKVTFGWKLAKFISFWMHK